MPPTVSTACIGACAKFVDMGLHGGVVSLIARNGQIGDWQTCARFTYGVSTDGLGAVVEKVSGQSLDAYVAEHITRSLQMVDTAYDVPKTKRSRLAKVCTPGKDGALALVSDPELVMTSMDKATMHWVGGGLFSTAGDYARFGRCC